MSEAADLAGQLQAKRTGPGAWMARCPAHDDRTASLSIGEGEDGRLLVRCHAGCSFDDIMAAAGIARAKPNGHANGQQKGRIVAKYTYRDARGEPVFEVRRYEPKDFRQARFDPATRQYICEKGCMAGVELVPYRLPEVVNASEIFVCEGEKDADNLAALGIVATTNPGGADANGEGGKKWPEGFGRYFDGRHAILIPDNDESGRRHVQAVARKLAGAAASIKVVELPGLPAKGDVSDWLAAGGSADQLRRLAEAAPYWEPDAEPGEAPKARVLKLRDYGAERLSGEPPAVKWLIEGSVPLGVPAVLAAMGDTGKSYMALQLCHHVTLEPRGNLDFNVPILGGQIAAQGTAVFLTSEDSEAAVHRRLAVIDPEEHRRSRPGKLIVVALPDAGGPMPLFVRDHDGVVITPEWPMLCDQLAAISDLKLVVFDPLANFAPVGLDKDSGDASAVASHFGTLAAQTGATVMATHHMRKAAEAPKTVAEARDRIRGSSGIVDGVRLAYALWPVEEADGKKTCNALQIPFQLNRVVCGAVVKANEQAAREIATYVRSDAGLLIDRTDELRARRPDRENMAADLVAAVAMHAMAGHPFTVSGEGGLYKQRERLPEALRTTGRDKLESLARDLIDGGRIVQCIASGSHHGKWLDVPGGKFALGTGEFEQGAAT